jgi:hypothetical protein
MNDKSIESRYMVINGLINPPVNMRVGMNCNEMKIAMILIASCSRLEKSTINRATALITNALPARYLRGVTGNIMSRDRKLSRSQAINNRTVTPENATMTARRKRSESSCINRAFKASSENDVNRFI